MELQIVFFPDHCVEVSKLLFCASIVLRLWGSGESELSGNICLAELYALMVSLVLDDSVAGDMYNVDEAIDGHLVL